MPYIKCSDIEYLLKGGAPRTKGELNYAITVLLIQYINEHGHVYSVMSDAVAAATDAAAECRRRVLDPYEDNKMIENGDVYQGLI